MQFKIKDVLAADGEGFDDIYGFLLDIFEKTDASRRRSAEMNKRRLGVYSEEYFDYARIAEYAKYSIRVNSENNLEKTHFGLARDLFSLLLIVPCEPLEEFIQKELNYKGLTERKTYAELLYYNTQATRDDLLILFFLIYLDRDAKSFIRKFDKRYNK